MKPVYSNDICVQVLNDQTVRVTLHLDGQHEKDFRQDDKTPERVVKWVKRKGGDADEWDVKAALAGAVSGHTLRGNQW